MKVYIMRITDAYIFDAGDVSEDQAKLLATNFYKANARKIPFTPVEHYLITAENQLVPNEKFSKIMDMPNLFGLDELRGTDGSTFHSSS